MSKMSDYIAECLGIMIAGKSTIGNYQTQLSDMMIAKFRWTAPEFFDEDWAERYLVYNGNFVGGMLPDGIPALAPNVSRTGNLNIYGDGTEANAPCRGTSGTITGIIGKDAFICYNNSQRMPETDLIYYPDVLAAIDRNVYKLIDWTKYPPMVCATDSKTQTAINKILDEADAGKPRAIVDDALLSSLSRGVSNDIYSVDLVDPAKIQLVQYLLEAHDVIIRRIQAKHGIDTRRTSKHAQVSVDEADGMQLASWVYPLDQLRQRQKFAAAWSARYPEYPISVEFAEPWASAYREFLAEQQLPAAEVKAAENGSDDQSEGGVNDDPTDPAG
jgi:hypothetical protein